MEAATDEARMKEKQMCRDGYRREEKRARGAVPSCIMGVALVLAVFLGASPGLAARPAQETFSSPADAVRTMVDAMKTGNAGSLLKIFGPAGRELFSSGDEAEDRQTREEFVKAYEEKNRLETKGKKEVVLHVGKDDWAWPIPLVRTGKTWRFDTRAGTQEILARRVGENELAAIQVCLAYVDAQREYAEDHRTGGVMEYAQKCTSDPGKNDGLCCEGKAGKESPLGPLAAGACKESGGGAAQPYHGYFYKILTKQGAHAPGGAHDYVVNGRMIGGFALVAYPASYGSSGVMTLLVNQDGVVYEKDLGKNTERKVEAMTGFDPDDTWKKVE